MTDNQNIWFKQKRFGWGWTPANAKGWAAVAVHLLSVGVYPLLCWKNQWTFSNSTFVAVAVVLTVIFVGVCYAKGEKPQWRWGDEPPDRPS